MLSPLVTIFFGLICLTTHGHAQDYDPILDMCVRFEHQCKRQIKVSYLDHRLT